MKKVYFNRENFKSRFFTGLFGSYILIIVCLFLLYSAVVFIENISVYKAQKKQYYQLKVQEIKNALDIQLVEADAIIANINASDTIRKYSQDWNTGSVSVADVINEIRLYTLSTNNINIYDTVLIFEDSDKSYTSTQVYQMYPAYNKEKIKTADQVQLTSFNALYGLRNTETIMTREWFLYSAGYSTLFADGTVYVLFDAESIARSLRTVLEEQTGYGIYINDRLNCGEEVNSSITYVENSGLGT